MKFRTTKKVLTLTILSFAFATFSLYAQQLDIDADASITKDGVSASISITTGKKNGETSAKPGAPKPLPSEYRSISLGMPIESVKEALLADSLYGYRGERDVSLLPTENRVLIESAGLSFLSRSWFQFYEGNLYTMTFKLDDDRVDFYSVFKSLQDKYGEPTSLDPEKIVWKDDSVTLSLERPLVLKYIDTQVFKRIQEASLVEKTNEEVTRQGFLDSL